MLINEKQDPKRFVFHILFQCLWHCSHALRRKWQGFTWQEVSCNVPVIWPARTRPGCRACIQVSLGRGGGGGGGGGGIRVVVSEKAVPRTSPVKIFVVQLFFFSLEITRAIEIFTVMMVKGAITQNWVVECANFFFFSFSKNEINKHNDVQTFLSKASLTKKKISRKRLWKQKVEIRMQRGSTLRQPLSWWRGNP